MKKIVLISSGQPSSNPRLVKEAMALAKTGNMVTVVYSFWAAWGRAYDGQIKARWPQINWVAAGGDPQTKRLQYMFTRIFHKLFRVANRLFPSNTYFAARAEIRGFDELLATACQHKADLYIAHNLGALPVAAKAAVRNGSGYAFDAEDFHLGQVPEGSLPFNRIKKLEESYLPASRYITAASPLIANQYAKLYHRNPVVINNVFPLVSTQRVDQENKEVVSLFWFSQTIGKGRGLEDVLQALAQLPAAKFSLTLLGYSDAATQQYFHSLVANDTGKKIAVTYLDPVHPDEIFRIAASFDIGLALEPGRDLNNEFALSNKIFTYLMAGNAIIFSATAAQKQFHEKHRGIGEIYQPGDVTGLAKILDAYGKDPARLAAQKRASRNLALEQYNWEREEETFLSLVKGALA